MSSLCLLQVPCCSYTVVWCSRSLLFSSWNKKKGEKRMLIDLLCSIKIRKRLVAGIVEKLVLCLCSGHNSCPCSLLLCADVWQHWRTSCHIHHFLHVTSLTSIRCDLLRLWFWMRTPGRWAGMTLNWSRLHWAKHSFRHMGIRLLRSCHWIAMTHYLTECALPLAEQHWCWRVSSVLGGMWSRWTYITRTGVRDLAQP